MLFSKRLINLIHFRVKCSLVVAFSPLLKTLTHVAFDCCFGIRHRSLRNKPMLKWLSHRRGVERLGPNLVNRKDGGGERQWG